MRADRLLSIMLLLHARGKMTAHELAEELGVSRRTILRDINALSFAGVPVTSEGGHGGGIELDKHYRVTLTGLKEAEIRALFLSNSSQLLDDLGLSEAADNTYRKLLAAVPALHQQTIDDIRQRVLVDPVWWWHDYQPMPFWDDLQTAVYEDRYIWAVYEHYDGTEVERVLEPYGLIAKASLWYLLGHRDGEFRTYRVSRFHRVTLLDTKFQRDDDFDLASYWNEHIQSFMTTLTEYRFTLRIHSGSLSYAKWYTPGQCEIIDEPDVNGWLTARFQVESESLARNFIMTLGGQAMVVEPLELRESVLQAAREILNQQGI